MDEVELHASPIRPFLERFRRELGAVIDRDRHRCARSLDRPVQGRDNVAAAEQLIMGEIHAPTLVRTLRLEERGHDAGSCVCDDAHACGSAGPRTDTSGARASTTCRIKGDISGNGKQVCHLPCSRAGRATVEAGIDIRRAAAQRASAVRRRPTDDAAGTAENRSNMAV
jgi:hypothetical protein